MSFSLLRSAPALALLLVPAAVPAASPAISAAHRGNPWINVQDGDALATNWSGPAAAVAALASGSVRPTALATADFDEDGVPDLVAGFAGDKGGFVTIHRGNVDALHPNMPEAQARRANGTFVDAPFWPDAKVLAVPVAPEFLGAGDFDADGHFDLVLADRAEAGLVFLPGDGHGGFGEPVRVPLAGRVTAMAVGDFDRRDGLDDLLVGLVTPAGPKLAVLEGPDGAARGSAELHPLPAPATAIALGELDGAFGVDAAVAAGSRVVVIHGRDRKLSQDDEARASVAAATVDGFDLPVPALALAIGNFVWDPSHRDDIAILGTDRSILVAVRGGAETGFALASSRSLLPAATSSTAGAPPALFRARTSTLPADDLVVVDAASAALHLVHGDGSAWPEDRPERAAASGLGLSASLDVDSEPVAALPMRLGVDAQTDFVVLKSGAAPLATAITAPMATFVVNSNNDVNDGVCNVTHCSLREAINAANAAGGADTINFAIGSGAKTIIPTAGLPAVGDSVTIDGTTQPGFAGTPIIELNGQSAGSSNGLQVNAYGTTVKGLVVNRFGNDGIVIGNDSSYVYGCYLGTDVTGTIDYGNAGDGVYVSFGYSTIGGPGLAARNVISGNGRGVGIGGSQAGVYGNYIGTNAAGTSAIGNTNEGVWIFGSGLTGNWIGTATAGYGNVISGNNQGINGTSGDFAAQGNYVGLNAGGTAAIANASVGIYVYSSSNCTVGGTSPAARNVSSGNSTGVALFGNARNNLVMGNFLGLNASGNAAITNSYAGVAFSSGASDNTIGGTASGARNVISGNNVAGIAIDGSDRVTVQGNFIGLSAAGLSAVGNVGPGVSITGSTSSSRIGGTISLARNVISGNGGAGIVLNTFGTGQTIQGNYIGTDAVRNGAISNATSGIVVTNGSWNLVGGSLGGANSIWWNSAAGISVSSSSVGNTISMNSFWSNGGLGIDLGGDGVTANDTGDADTGANNLQNAPVLDSVVVDSGTVVAGHLNSQPLASYTVELFSSTQCDGYGAGEGTSYLGSAVVTTNAFGDVSFVISVATLVPPGNVITATATDSDGNTSEFSACQAVTGPELVFHVSSINDTAGNGNGVLDLAECVSLTVTLRNVGSSSATNVGATLASGTPGVVVGQPNGTWPNIAGGATASNVIPFTVSATAPLACGGTMNLVLTVQSTQRSWVIPFSLTTGMVRYSATGPVTIPDATPAGIDLPLVVPATAGTITNVTASIHLKHTWDSDLVISLVHPDATSVVLVNRRGGSADNFGLDCPAGSNDTILDGSAVVSIGAGFAPFAGTWHPEGNLAAFNGKSPTGTWKLHAVDTAGSDVGTIECWTLSFATDSTCSAAPGACSAPAGEPNPLVWTPGSETSLQWGAAANALGYNVYRGSSVDLPKVLDPTPDSCLAASTTALSTGGILTAVPAAGDFDWYLVRAVGPIGEGTPGSSSSGPEIQDSKGFCP